MRVLMYMAQTANGIIATENDEVSFVSHASWDSFDALSRKAKNIIIGYGTYEVSVADGTFPYGNRYNIIVSKKHASDPWKDNYAFVSSPREALQLLESNGFTTAFVGGGSSLNASFLKEGLVDELIIDIEPMLLGSGKPLFAPLKDTSIPLELLKVKKLTSQEVQLHYKIHKHE